MHIFMTSLLNVEKIIEKLQVLGLTQASVAGDLNVSREAVSKWLKNETFPRPDKLLKLARRLELSFSDLVIAPPATNEPVVAFRKKGRKKITPEYLEQARDMGRILATLVPLLPFDELSQPTILKSPSTDYSYIQKVAKRIRGSIGIPDTDEVPFPKLIQFFNELHAIIIPVLRGDKENHDNALHIYLPASMTTWIYLNLDCRVHDFKYWMCHELGHVHAPQLGGDLGEDFSEAFAGALLVPEELAQREYGQLRRLANIGKQINQIKSVADHLVVSPFTVYSEINKYAAHHQLPKIDLESNNEIHKATSNFNKNYNLVSEYIFDTKTPSPHQYVACAKEQFGSPFFEMLRTHIADKRKSASFIQAILNIPLLDAQNIYEELC